MVSIIEPNSDIYKSLFDYNHDACYAIDLKGNFLQVNDAAINLAGYEREEILQMSFISILQEDYIDKAIHYFTIVLQGNRQTFDISIKNKKGNRVDLTITAVPMTINGKIQGIAGAVKDMTEKNKLESILSGQNNVLEMIAKGSPFPDVLDKITYIVEKSTKGGACLILLADGSGMNLLHGSSPSLPIEYCNYVKQNPIGKVAGPCGTAAFQKRTIIVNDIENDPLWTNYKDEALKHGLKACWSSPIYDNHQEIIGVLEIYFDKPAAPNEEDMEIIERAIYLTSLAIQHYRAEEKINFLAFHDELTGLANRRLFNQTVNNAISRDHKDDEKMLGILFLDLDRFKLINDSLGHTVGDQLLREVAQRIQSCIRTVDLASRQGGDEFTILLDDLSKEMIKIISQSILTSLSQSFFIDGHEIFVTPSIGISLYPKDSDQADDLIRKADIAMYKVKNEGRNSYKFYESNFDHKTSERLEMENELRKALDKKEFTLQYQPIIRLSTNKPTCVEALIRWNNLQLGQVSPDRFIPIAEETGMIVEIGEWVLRTACQQWKQWETAGLGLSSIAVNISIRQFYQPNLISMIASILNETKMAPKHLTIEITETMTMDVQTALTILKDLKSLGVNISIDDFGTGYSSLSYLKTFPIDYLKIDQSFTQDLAHNKDSENIATTILLMAHSLGLSVIAEGVETTEQLEILRKYNCQRAQGYLFSRPLPAKHVEQFLVGQILPS